MIALNFIDGLVGDGVSIALSNPSMVERNLIVTILEHDFTDYKFMIEPTIVDFVNTLVSASFDNHYNTYRLIELHLRKLINNIYR